MDDATLSVEELYHQIARHIMRAIEGPWTTATLYAEIEEEDNGLFYGRYKETEQAREEKFFDPHFEVLDLFVALRQQLHKPGTAPWQKASFTLDRSGRFTLDFIYPPEDESTAEEADC